MTPDHPQSPVSDRQPPDDARIFSGILIGLLLLVTVVEGAKDDWTDALPFAGIVVIALMVLRTSGTLVDTRFDKFKTGVWILPIAGFAITIIAVGEEAGTKDFHSAAAQVIPVLALGLAIEARAFTEQLAGANTARATALVTLSLLAYGEYEALDSLAGPIGRDAELVWAALLAGALGVLLVASLGTRATSSSACDQEDQRPQEGD